MIRWLTPLALTLALPLGGCIVYDTNGKCPDCDPEHNGGNPDHDDTAVDTATDTGRPGDDTGASANDTGDDTGDPATAAFALSPNVGTAGTTFIAHLRAADASFDFSTVTELTFYGGVNVLASEAAPGELLLTLEIPAASPAGMADLLIATSNGEATFLEGALQILAADTGNGGTDTGDCG